MIINSNKNVSYHKILPQNLIINKQVLEEKGGFIYAHWDGTEETEDKIKTETDFSLGWLSLLTHTIINP